MISIQNIYRSSLKDNLCDFTEVLKANIKGAVSEADTDRLQELFERLEPHIPHLIEIDKLLAEYVIDLDATMPEREQEYVHNDDDLSNYWRVA